MRRTTLWLALLAALMPGLAWAQGGPGIPNFTMPSNTVICNLSSITRPAQACPFATIGPNLITNFLKVTAPLSISGLNLSITGTAGGVLAGSGATFTATPTLGVAGTTSGTLTLANSGNTGTVTLAAPSSATSHTITFPPANCLNGQSWTDNGSGVMSCAATSGTVNSGTAGQLTYYATSAAAVSGNANLNISAGALTIGVAGSTVGTVALVNATSGSIILATPSGALGSQTLTLPDATDQLIARATTDTLTNKTYDTAGTGNVFKINGTGISAVTGTGSVVLATSPTLVTPVLGVATATTLNGLTVTTSTGTLTIANGKTLTANNSITIAGTDAKTLTLTNSLTVTTNDGTLAFGNASKTLTVNNSLTLAGTDSTTITFQGTDTYVGRATTDTLTNKTLTSPAINTATIVGGTATALTGLGIRSTGTGAFDLTLANTENLTAGRSLTITLNNANRNLNLSGDIVTAASFTTSGANAMTLVTTGTTNVTLPTSGTLATQNVSNTFSATNTFTAANTFTALTTLSSIALSAGKISPTADSTTAMQFTKADGSTNILDVDTNNKRIGINTTAPSFDLSVSGTIGFTTLDPTSLSGSPTTVSGLPINNSPNANNDYVPYFNASSNLIKRITISSLISAATAGVSSLNGLSGALSIVNGNGLSLTAAGSSVTIADYLEPGTINNCILAGTVSGNALTVTLQTVGGGTPSASVPCAISFRNATQATGDYAVVTVTASTTFATGTSGSTFGTSNATPFKLWITAINNGGTVVLGVSNQTTSTAINPLNEGVIQSTTACNACTNATAAGTIYSTAAQSNKAVRILGYMEWNAGLTTAGTWASGPTSIQLMGPGVKKPGDVVQEVLFSGTASTTSTSSASFVATNVTKAITPTMTSNPVDFDLVTTAGVSNATDVCNVDVAISSTEQGAGPIAVFSGNGNGGFPTAVTGISSPGSTSSQTYTARVKCNGTTTITVPQNNTVGNTLRLKEIMGSLEPANDNINPAAYSRIG